MQKYASNNINDLMKTRQVMQILGYSAKSKRAFWATVYREGIPHIRVNQRLILFPKAGFADWLNSRAA
jgi:hypothetical protein